MDVEREANLKQIDRGVKNRFNWRWLESKDSGGYFLSDYMRKIDIAGKARCIVCNQIVSYGSSGMKALVKHGNCDAHKNKRKIRDENQTLPAVFKARRAVKSGDAGQPTQTAGDKIKKNKIQNK